MPVTVTGIDSSASSVVLQEAHSQRTALSIYNASTAALYINYDAAAATTKGNYVIKIEASGYFELPITDKGKVCSRQIRGIWASANGFANITQYTAE